MRRKGRRHAERIAELERRLAAEDERLERILAARTRVELLDAEHDPVAEPSVPAVRAAPTRIVVVALAAFAVIVWGATRAASHAPAPSHRVASPAPRKPVPTVRSTTAVASAMPSITGQPQVFLMPAGGGRARELNPDGDSSPAIAPEWKPDGTALAVSTGADLLEVGVARGGRSAGSPSGESATRSRAPRAC
jgi:hypothetical protein